MVELNRQRKVRIVLSPDNQSWIIEKMARRLSELVREYGFVATIASEPDNKADLNHWMSYAFANVRHSTPTSMLITHLDDPYKVRLVRNELLSGVSVGVCLSSATVDFLVSNNIDRSSLTYVIPAHDFVAQPRRVTVGITTRLYPDGRKRESMLVSLARSMSLDAFRFEIFGMGWETVIPELEAAGAEVVYWPGTFDYEADYRTIAERLPHFDYYLYMGRDEGSLGTLDALAAGVKTIVTPQGFHVDISDGITHPFWDQHELQKVFEDIAEDRASRCAGVAELTWTNYARDHAIIWDAILSGQADQIENRLAQIRQNSPRQNLPKFESQSQFMMRYLSPYRVRSALSHLPLLKPVRKFIKSRQKL